MFLRLLALVVFLTALSMINFLFFLWKRYLHGNFQPPIVHRNFKSANVLLNEKLEVRVSDCGLGSLLSSGSAGQVSLILISSVINFQLTL